MDGLEIKVQLGSLWKQSLTELSGGQRYAPHAWRVPSCGGLGDIMFTLRDLHVLA